MGDAGRLAALACTIVGTIGFLYRMQPRAVPAIMPTGMIAGASMPNRVKLGDVSP